MANLLPRGYASAGRPAPICRGARHPHSAAPGCRPTVQAHAAATEQVAEQAAGVGAGLPEGKAASGGKAGQAAKRPITDLQVGQKVKGRVTQVRDWGVFVRLEGGYVKDALLHITQVAKKGVYIEPSALREMFPLGKEVEGYVREVNPRLGRLGLSSHHIERPLSSFEDGAAFQGTVKNIAEGLGAFVDVGAERDGLLHISKIPDPPGLDGLEEGQSIEGTILKVNLRDAKLSLTMLPYEEQPRGRRARGEDWYGGERDPLEDHSDYP